jgi:predicted nucleotide-binding protein
LQHFLETDIPSKKDIPAVLDFLSRELSDIVLNLADVDQLQKRTFERESSQSQRPALKETRKPLLLISSSLKGLEYAEAVRRQLEYSVLTEMWTEQQFKIGQTAVENLIRNAGRFDFAAFVLTSDDLGWLRGDQESTARTNIAFEAGFFVGRLGSNRTFFLLPESQRPFSFISDLAGVATVTYDPERRPIDVALGPGIHRLVSHIHRFGSVGSKRLHDESDVLMP